MANSKIVITFNAEATVGDVIQVKRRKINDPLTFSIDGETFIATTRTQNGYIAVATASGYPGYVIGHNTAYNFAYYFNLDYNAYGLYAITPPDSIATNIVEILCTNDEWEFYDFVGGDFSTAVTTNFVPSTYKIDSTTFGISAINPCTSYKINLVTSEPTVRYYLNDVMYEAAYGTSFSIELLRGVPNYLRLQDVNYSTVYSIAGHSLSALSSDNIGINIIQSLTGATVTINVAFATGLILQYSLDGITWQSSNVFTGQAVGNYTIYVKDDYNCTKTKDYTVYARGERVPYLYISGANSIGFKEQLAWDNYEVFKNDENTLVFQGDENLKDCSIVLFQTGDITRVQVKSNYSTVEAFLRKEDLSEVGLVLEKMSNNLDRFARMDATYYKYKTGKVGIFFDTGWTYTNAGVQIEEYTLNGNLPDLAALGNLISVDGLGIFEIKDVIYDEAITKKVIVIDYTYEGDYTPTKVEAIYDLLPFEVYELEIDWSEYGEGTYDILLENTDLYNATRQHLSENIEIKTVHENTIAIKYFNRNNRDIFYKYGIQHFIRVPLISSKVVPKDDTEININDDNVVVSKSTVHEAREFTFDALTQDIMFKLVIALSCDYVFIQNIGYAKDGSVDVQNKDNTNVYILKATMIKKGVNYDVNSGGETGIDIGGTGFTMPVILGSELPTFIIG